MITKIKAVRVQEVIMSGSANVIGNIRFNNIDELKIVIPKLDENLYNSKINAIKENIELAKQYAITEDWLYNNIFIQ